MLLNTNESIKTNLQYPTCWVVGCFLAEDGVCEKISMVRQYFKILRASHYRLQVYCL